MPQRDPIGNRAQLGGTPARETALGCLSAGLQAARPERLVADAVRLDSGRLRVSGVDGGQAAVSLDDYDRLVVVGGGKAAAGVARGLTRAVGERIDAGLVVTPEPATLAGPVETREGGHPLPTAESVAATEAVLDRAAAAGPETLILAPITGGGSATLAAPAGVSLDRLRSVTRELLDAGASIRETNAVRRRLSRVKGGRLVTTAAPARVLGLLVSDVVADPAVIASGPTLPDPETTDARRVLDRYEVGDRAVREAVAANEPPAAEPAFERAHSVVIGDGRTALRAAAACARERGADARIVSDRVTGEASRCGRRGAALAASVASRADASNGSGESNPTDEPDDPSERVSDQIVLLAGGETTVRVTGSGWGGPNCEYAAAAGGWLAGQSAGTQIACGAIDTDGADGSSEIAGGLVDGTTLAPERAADRLAANDAGHLLTEAGAAVRTGPTGTNVDDLRVWVIDR